MKRLLFLGLLFATQIACNNTGQLSQFSCQETENCAPKEFCVRKSPSDESGECKEGTKRETGCVPTNRGQTCIDLGIACKGGVSSTEGCAAGEENLTCYCPPS